MDGYQVLDSDDSKLGEVVASEGDLLIVEHGHLRKSRHAIPKAFAHPDDDERVVRLTVAKELVADSPEVDDDRFDRRAVLAHYGLAEGEDAPATEGRGELEPDDPAWSAEQQERRSGVEPAAEQRARMREGESEAGPHGRQIIPPDPHEGP